MSQICVICRIHGHGQMLLGLWEKDIQGEVLVQDSQFKTFSAWHDYIHAIE